MKFEIGDMIEPIKQGKLPRLGKVIGRKKYLTGSYEIKWYSNDNTTSYHDQTIDSKYKLTTKFLRNKILNELLKTTE